MRTADSTIIIITNFYLAASSHEIFLTAGGREGMKGLGALQRHQLPHPPCKNPGSATDSIVCVNPLAKRLIYKTVVVRLRRIVSVRETRVTGILSHVLAPTEDRGLSWPVARADRPVAVVYRSTSAHTAARARRTVPVPRRHTQRRRGRSLLSTRSARPPLATRTEFYRPRLTLLRSDS